MDQHEKSAGEARPDIPQSSNPAAAMQPPFEIGLVLAGAISAGAYTAGVMDFLFQALTEWEEQRGKTGAPDHRVVVKVIAGASAGAITGALGAVALARGLSPRKFSDMPSAPQFYPDRYAMDRQELQCVLPAMYRTWVELPAMIGPNGSGGLLGTADIDAVKDDPSPLVRSLLDASVLDSIKVAAIEPYRNGMQVKKPVPFIAKNLHLYITVSNMRGIPFKVAFGKSSYGMQTIGDRIHYVVRDLGSTDLSGPNCWAALDGQKAGMPISVRALPEIQTGQLSPDWDLFGTSALASGAFPLGLAPRRLSFPYAQYQERRYPLPGINYDVIKPNFPMGTGQTGNFIFETVDGGLVNNNPFDYAQYALTGEPPVPVNGTDARNAIVMVAPFPEPPEFPPEGSPSPAIPAIVRALFPALITQARFRASELAPAVDERDFSRFLVAPLRRIPSPQPRKKGEEDPLERYAIACGLLGGFGGFLDEKFRDHDFQLGRRNCQQFLRTSFHVKPDNPIVRGEVNDEGFKPVIPLVGTARKPIPLPVWPQMSEDDFDKLCEQVKTRTEAVIPALVRAQTQSRMLRGALRVGWWAFVKRRALEFIRLTMLADLVRRSQITGWLVPQAVDDWAKRHGRSHDDVQAVLAELIVPSFDYRTPQGVANATRLPADFVAATLGELSGSDMPDQLRAWQSNHGWTIRSRRRPPGLLKRLRPVRWLRDWWSRPAVN